MIEERRHPAPGDAEGLDELPDELDHRVLYPLLGVVIGLLVPVGAFVLRYLQAGPVLRALWVRSELGYNAVFYIYMAAGSVLCFVAFGYVVGRWSESQRVHNKDLRERVRGLHLKSVTDGLTGAFSHAYMQETLGIELERALRHGRPVSVLMLDLDDFKKINDTYGHLFGDRVLKELTETVSMNIRHEDVLGRYGGEEFLVILPGADPETARSAGERVRRAVARAGIRTRDGDGDAVRTTVSVGIATFAGEGPADAKALIGAADRNLYRAKREGKDRVAA